MDEHPRDLVGYGRRPPQAAWPDEARVALSLVVNYEEGAERTLLNGDPESEHYLTELPAVPRPSRNLVVESLYEYGSRVGVWRLLDAFDEAGLPMTMFACGQTAELAPDPIRQAAQAGHEICSHGYRWYDYDDVPYEVEVDHLGRTIRALEAAAGRRPVGWYTGRMSMQTRRIVVEEGGFLYDSDSYADELPYWTQVAGRQHLVVPYTLDANDAHFSSPNGYATADDFATYLIDSFECLHREGATTPRMMSVGLHCRIVGRPGRIDGLRRFLEHVRKRGGAWVATREQIARHWIEHHPPA